MLNQTKSDKPKGDKQMKKFTALLLALCMLLAVVPVLGEEGPAGNWYMTLADVTLGYILLNEDGTAVMNVASQDEISGTWTADGDTVTITAQGQPVDFAYDGSSLKSDLFPLSLGREEGRLPMDILTKMMSGEEYELPEGLTELDVTTMALNFMAEYTKIMEESSDQGGELPTAAPAAAQGENPVVTIENGTFKVNESYSGFRGTYIARIKNENDVPLFLTGGSMQVFDADGNQAAEASYLSRTGSKYLEPGETSFVSFYVDLEKDGDYTYQANIETKTESYRSTDVAVKVTDPVFVKVEGEYNSDLMKATVTNEGDTPMAGIQMVLVLVDADGNLLDLDTQDLYRNELGAGSSITLVSTVDDRVKKFYEANGFEPVAVEAYAWVENND